MDIFFTLLVQPLLNVLVLFYNLPIIGLGGAIILLTLLIKFLLFPLNSKAIRFQKKFQVVQIKMKEIQEKYKDNMELSSQKTLELLKKEKVNPFMGFLPMLLQIPIMIGLFFILKEGIDLNYLYDFVYNPGIVSSDFFGIDLSVPNLVLAGITAVSQFAFSKVMQAKTVKGEKGKKKKADSMTAFGKYIVYLLPIITFFISLTLPAALAVYWTTNALASIAQHLYINHADKKTTL